MATYAPPATASVDAKSEENRRIPLSRLDTHRDQKIAWETEEDKQTASETLSKMADAFSTLIENVGERSEREGLVRTPVRAAKALCFFTKGYEDNLSSKFEFPCHRKPLACS